MVVESQYIKRNKVVMINKYYIVGIIFNWSKYSLLFFVKNGPDTKILLTKIVHVYAM